MPGQVFISYCREDSEAAHRICARLEAGGLRCWIAPRNIPPGQEWAAAIAEAIKASNSLVLVLSSHSAKSRQLGREIDLADRNRVRTISFRLENVDLPLSLEYYLNNLQWIDGFTDRFDSGVQTLQDALLETASTVVPLQAAPKPPAKPSHRRKLAISLLVAFVLTFVVQALEYYGLFATPDGLLMNGILTGRRPPAAAAANPVAVLKIDNEAFQNSACFANTSPLNPSLVVSLVQQVFPAGPRVVGVDIFTEGEKYRSATFNAVGPTVIWMAGSESDSHIEVASLPRWLFGASDHIVVKPTKVLGHEPAEFATRPDIHWGIPAFPPDDDFTIRRFPRQIEASADPQGSSHRQVFPSWDTQLAQEYCRRGGSYCAQSSADELYVSYAEPFPTELNLLDYFSCNAGSTLALRPGQRGAFDGRVRDKVLLIGGTFRPSGKDGDLHNTPKGQLPGVFINAFAVRAEIEGAAIHDVRQPWALLLDFALGAMIVLIFYPPFFDAVTKSKSLRLLKKYEIRSMMCAGLALLILFFVVVRLWPGPAYLKGITGVAFGVLLHQMFEVFYMNPRRRETDG